LHLQVVLHFATYFDLNCEFRLISLIEKWIEVVELVELEGSNNGSVVMEMILFQNSKTCFIYNLSVWMVVLKTKTSENRNKEKHETWKLYVFVWVLDFLKSEFNSNSLPEFRGLIL
jgi:hypothetical protein